MSRIDFNAYSAAYARNRSVQPLVLERIIDLLGVGQGSRVLEVGCGTANYARAIAQETRGELYGIDPHAAMIEQALAAGGEIAMDLREGSAEAIPFPDSTFDAIYSVDVIHHVQGRTAYAAEALRVLKPGGSFLTATDSTDDIRGRIPLSTYFPETVPPELTRYPAIDEQLTELRNAGFTELATEAVAYEYALVDIAPYEARAFSALRLIDDAAWEQGLDKMRADLSLGPIPAVSRYTIISART
jgi:ubiquinone/menaquinone biosynthesis C-methylase UbiE